MSEIERVPLKSRMLNTDYYSTDGSYKIGEEIKADKEAARKRQHDIVKSYNEVISENQVQTSTIWRAARTPNAFSVNAQQALSPFMDLNKGDKVNVFDIEAVGTPTKMRGKDGIDLFAITELSFGGTEFTGEGFSERKGQMISMAVAPGKDEYQRMKAQIQSLKENPFAAISKDMHRTLLDLTKYADESKFEQTTKNGGKVSHMGLNYTSITGHARTVQANSAMTRGVISEIDRGLENLAKMGTPVTRALEILKRDTETKGGVLGGYNIHNYDLPAILDATKDAKQSTFFEKALSSSLDFYHAYNAVEKDPVEKTGHSLRQEHIHQFLMANNKITPQQSKYLYHLAKDDIQANIEIAGYTYNEIKKHIDMAESGKFDYALNPNVIDKSPIKVGDNVFSFQSGFFDERKHKYNLVADAKGKEIKPRWEDLNTSMPANESFTVSELMEGISLPGTDKKGYGVRLDSKDFGSVDPRTGEYKGKSVFMFSETKEELAQQLHGSFLPADGPMADSLRELKYKHDASFREYDKMFQEGGADKAKKFYGYLNSGNANDASFDWKQHILNNGGTEELALKFEHMVPRLKEEQGIWEKVSDELNRSTLSDEQKDAAMRTVKQKLDKEGKNRVDVTSEGNRFFNFDFGLKPDTPDETVFNARNTDQIKNAFRGYIRGRRHGDRVGDPEKGYKQQRIAELQELIVKNFGFEQDGKESKKVKEIADGMISQVQNGGKIEASLTAISNFVRDEVETRGKGTFKRDTASKVTKEYSLAISGFTESLPEVIQSSISQARTHVKATDALKRGSKLDTYVREQDKRIQELFQRNFTSHGMNDSDTIKTAASKASKYGDIVQQIVEKYSYDFNTQITMGPNGNPMMVLADKKSGINMSDARTYEDIVKNPKLAVVELPSLDENLMSRYEGNQMASMVRSGISKKKELVHSTTVTDALNMILDYSSKAKQIAEEAAGLGEQNGMLKIRQGLSYRVRKQIAAVPINANRKLSYDEKKMMEANNAIATKVKSAKWDITGFAEQWYDQNQKNFRTPLATVKRKAESEFISFFDAMDQQAKGMAIAGGLMQFAEEQTGIKSAIFGMNNSAASKGYVGTGLADARSYMALGNYYADSVENPQKTVNYQKMNPSVAHSVLRRSGRDHKYRTENSFISSDAFDVLKEAEEIRGLTLQTGYMTDEEVALKLKDANQVKKYKEWIDKAKKEDRISSKEARQMKDSLDLGMLSTSEGLAFMDHELMKAYNGVDEVRLSVSADSISLDQTIEDAINKQAMKQGFEDGAWKNQRIEFTEPVFIDASAHMKDGNRLTVGKYTVNNITQTLQDENHFRDGDRISILGFDGGNVKDQTLIFGRRRKTGHGFKAVTEGGFRATMTGMLQEIIADIYGVDGVEQIISHLGEKKGVNDMASLVRGYDTQIRQQFDGTNGVKNNLKGYSNAEDALGDFYKDVREMVGIETVNHGGQRTVASDIGLNEEFEMSYAAREALSQKWMGKLGITKEVFADITMKHDVWDRQGGADRGKFTMKELDMLRRSYNRTGMHLEGGESEHVKFMSEMIHGEGLSAQERVQHEAFKEKVGAIGRYDKGWTPQAGDAVIDFTADGFGAMTDVNAVERNGVLNIALDTFESMPNKAGVNQTYTDSDYSRTILNAQKAEFLTEQMESKETVGSYMLKNQGAMYMKLPEYASEEYLPLVDAGRFAEPGAKEKPAFLNEVQSHYAKIERKMKEHTEAFASQDFTAEQVAAKRTRLESEINYEINAFKETLGAISSNKGMAEVTARRMPMSTQLQFGGVNPAMAYTKDGDKWSTTGAINEGEMIANRNDVRRMIGDNAENFIKSWGEDASKIEGDLVEYVLDNMNEKGVYSTNIRYPSIDSGTTQSMKLKVSDAVGEGQIVGMRGSAERISGDFDGDNLAVFLSHYGIEDDSRRQAVLKDVKKLHTFDKAKNELMAEHMMEKMESDFKTKIANAANLAVDHEDVASISNAFFSNGGLNQEGLTLGKLHGSEAIIPVVEKALQEDANYDGWGVAKRGQFGAGSAEHEKSVIARASAMSIGSADNTRMRVSSAFMSMAEVKYKNFNSAEGSLKYTQNDYIRETAVVDEFLREFSQKAISAKKQEGGKKTAQEMMGDIYNLIDEINSPSGKNLDTIANDLVERGVFKSKPFLEIGEGEIFKGSSHAFIKDALQLLGDAEDVFSDMGINGYRESSLLLGASQGIGFEKFNEMLRTGAHMPGRDSTEYVSEIAKHHGQDNMGKHAEHYEKAIVRSHERRMTGISQSFDDMADTMELNDTRKLADPDIVPNSQVPVYRTIRDQMDRTFSDIMPQKPFMSGSAATVVGVGAAGFAALWATNTLGASAPTPEGLQEMAPVPMETFGSPTARVTPNGNGEYLNIQINAKAAKGMNSHDLAALVNNEVMGMSQMQMQTNVNVHDNSENINGTWVEGAVANSMNKGYAY